MDSVTKSTCGERIVELWKTLTSNQELMNMKIEVPLDEPLKNEFQIKFPSGSQVFALLCCVENDSPLKLTTSLLDSERSFTYDRLAGYTNEFFGGGYRHFDEDNEVVEEILRIASLESEDDYKNTLDMVDESQDFDDLFSADQCSNLLDVLGVTQEELFQQHEFSEEQDGYVFGYISCDIHDMPAISVAAEKLKAYHLYPMDECGHGIQGGEDVILIKLRKSIKQFDSLNKK